MVKRSRLVFDSKAAQRDLTKRLIKLTDEIILRFFYEATEGIDEFFDIDIEEAELAAGRIKSRVIFGAATILHSYGTGSLADKSNPALQEYMNSVYFNPARRGMLIVGRPEGFYRNIFGGNDFYSAGKFEGYVMEGRFTDPIKPTYSIQNAEKWLKAKDGYVQRYLDYEIRNFVKSMGKYFRNV